MTEVAYDPMECNVPKLHEQIVYLINKMRFPWIDFEKEKPEKSQSVIVLTKYGMHYYQYLNDDPLNMMCGLFYIPRNGSCAGLRYSVEMSDITHWVPLPEAYDS